ncbi:MAG: alpha-amylase family glycosyl hydrolase [Planctomycetota bacterium]|jgi:maltose alpha-D-glucosyltransferase/alpha-amylase|nr:alpha-amylase family glycosyl hydrolase [Planctomycetota bacterium]
MSPAWLADAVIYQIYPQSFQDSNGDGIGDLQGIIQRLDYLQSLGVTTLWLNPCFDSPFGDAGYDVRDFFQIAPRYGSNADMDALCAAARARDMHVVLDLVAGHTSMDNPWFVAAAADPTGPAGQRYIWPKPDFDRARGPQQGDFISNFFWYQPALNFGYVEPTEAWQDPIDAPGPQANRQALRDIIAYWMDRGVAGFRVDMAASLVKEDPGKCETIRLWQDLRAWFEAAYPEGILVAEWSDPADSVPAGFHLDFMMHFHAPGYPSLFFNGTGTLPAKEGPCYFADDGAGDPALFLGEYHKQLTAIAGRGFVSLPSANHDFQRLRCGPRGWAGLRPAWVFLATQAGPPTVYYGDEIGMRFVTGTPAKEGSTLMGVVAPNAGAPDGERAGTRTPMQWDASGNAGFSTAPAEQCYLPLDDDPERPTVAAAEADPDSLLHFIRGLLRLRREHPALGSEGSFEPLMDGMPAYPLVYRRALADAAYLVAINPSAQAVTRDLPVALGDALLVAGASGVDGALQLEPYGYGIWQIA